MEGFALTEGINLFFVFAEGILSFFSPCVIPLLPLYISYLAGSAKTTAPDGSVIYRRGRVFLQTVFFVIGICVSFFLLGLGFSALGRFFGEHRTLFTSIGGILILLLGLFQLGAFKTRILDSEHRLPFQLQTDKMNPLIAFVMGFTFSFAWTPCVGPMLSSVLIMASSASSALVGNLLVALYCVGFVIPFLLLGLFTAQVLNFLKKRQNWLKYTVRIGGILMILIGILMITGLSDRVNSYFSSLGGGAGVPAATALPTTTPGVTAQASQTPSITPTPNVTQAPQQQEVIAAFDFTLTDQNGNVHTLSDYRGKVVFLNFWASWCGPCQSEMPHIEELYREYGENSGEVVFLGVANPGGQDVGKAELTEFINTNGYTFPTVFDETGSVFADYYIRSFPTTFMIDAEGNIYGYVSGALSKDKMKNIIEQTKLGNR